MIIANPFQPGSYETILSQCGGEPLNAFTLMGLGIAKRFFSQQSVIPPSDEYLTSFLAEVWRVVHAEGLPKPIANNEQGQAITMDDGYLSALCDKTLANIPRHRADDAIRMLGYQLLVCLLSPEFRACRLSYEEKDSLGHCARQSLDLCKERISGSHCEDCPFFVALSPEKHQKLLLRSFGDAQKDEFIRNKKTYLPEDYRTLRIFWHLHLRAQP